MIAAAKRLALPENSFRSIININKSIAVPIIFITAVIAFSNPLNGSYIFMSALILFLFQIFSTRDYLELLKARQLDLCAENNIETNEASISTTSAIAMTIKDGFFLLFICFDFIWLLSAYINPFPVNTFNEYVQRLQFGPISGTAFLIFTLLFFFIYLIFYFIGTKEYSEIIGSEFHYLQKIHFTISSRNFKNEKILINGFRLSNKRKQPLILCPGFYQNGYFYDVHVGEESLAEYLWKNGFDIWVYHPRGTENTSFAKKINTLDDYASEDIPSVIKFVKKSTGTNPIFIGHSQGGITALISMMGAEKSDDKIILSDEAADERQRNLKALITLGSYPDFTFDKPTMARDLATEGVTVNIFKRKLSIIKPSLLLGIAGLFNRLPVPVPIALRKNMGNTGLLRIVLFPLTFLLDFVATMKLWEFLYHIPNVTKKSRKLLFYNTIQATFSGILRQFSQAVINGRMECYDKTLCYSEYYNRIKLPVVIVTMEHDSLAHPEEAKRVMFPKIGSAKKYFVEWKDQGHEDFVMNPDFFPQVLEAVKMVNG